MKLACCTVVCLLSALWFGGCSSDDSGVAAAGGSAGSDAAIASFGSSGCGQCIQAACKAQVTSCSSDPECTSHLDCVLGCPTAPTGNVQESCASACPAPGSTAGVQAWAALDQCRATSAPGCASCGATQPDAGDAEAGAQSWILTQTCSKSTETNACAICEDEHCCKSYEDCKNDAECQAFKKCAQDCFNTNGVNCWATCAESHPKGVEHIAPRMACIDVFCGDQDACGTDPQSECDKCVNTNCADSWVNFYADPEGYLLYACTEPCSTADLTCFDACEQKYPAGAKLFEVFKTCSANHCSAECG